MRTIENVVKELRDYCEIREDLCNEILEIYEVEQRPKGHWVKHDTGHSEYFDCSLCGCLAPCTEVADGMIWKLSNYCSDCGAEMKGDEKE